MVATRLAAAQVQLGHDLAIVCYRVPGSEADIARATAGVPGFERVAVHAIEGGTLERLTAGRARKVLGPLVSAADVVHLHGLWEPLLPVAAALARRAAVPYIVSPHGMLDPWSLAQRRLKKRLALALVHRRMLGSAAFLYVLNRDEARLIEPLRLGTPTRVIPNGVFLEEIDPLPEPGGFYARHAELGGKPFVLFLSRLHYKKGLDILADAFARVARDDADIHLIVAGPDDGARAEFESRVREANLADRVHLVGPLYGREKVQAMVDAACFCLPSRQEGFSVAITEAMACRLPVVISDACHFPEVADAGAGEIVPLDASATGDGLSRVLRDPQRRQRMGAAGRELVESRYTWPRVAELAIQAYASVTG